MSTDRPSSPPAIPALIWKIAAVSALTVVLAMALTRQARLAEHAPTTG